jgi:hypothetical protein
VFAISTGETVPAQYEPHELDLMRQLKDKLSGMEAGPERTRLLNEVMLIHEMKARFDGYVLNDEEHAALWRQDEPLPAPGDNRVGVHHVHGRPTEVAAATLQLYRSGTARQRVLDEIFVSGSEGRTDEEISLKLDMRLYTAAPRRNELLNDGWVMEAGHKRLTSTGSSAVVWVMTDKGRREYERLTSGRTSSLISDEPEAPAKVTTTLL